MKRQKLIETAFELFYKHGIHAVGINQILTESGVAKKTLYHYFPGKDQLVSAVVAYRDEKFFNWLESRLATVSPGIIGINALFDALDDWFNNQVEELLPFHGCFFINTCAEFGDPTHVLHQQCMQHKNRIADLIEHQVRHLKVAEQDIQTITESISLLKEGAIVLAHVQGKLESAQMARQSAEKLLQAYL